MCKEFKEVFSLGGLGTSSTKVLNKMIRGHRLVSFPPDITYDTTRRVPEKALTQVVNRSTVLTTFSSRLKEKFLTGVVFKYRSEFKYRKGVPAGNRLLVGSWSRGTPFPTETTLTRSSRRGSLGRMEEPGGAN